MTARYIATASRIVVSAPPPPVVHVYQHRKTAADNYMMLACAIISFLD